MVRRRLEIKLIEDKRRRTKTFLTRRQGLFKKTHTFAALLDAQAAVIIFSSAGKLFSFGHPSVDSIVSRYHAEKPSEPAGDEGTSGGSGGGAEGERLPAITEEAGKRISQALQSGRWYSAVEGLGLREIDELYQDISKIKTVVAARAAEVEARVGDGFTGSC